MGNARIGIRPDTPTFCTAAPESHGKTVTENRDPNCDDPCAQFDGLVAYGETLQEAYHTRATQNRVWIYAAGTMALGTVAASGGLAAAGVAGLTIALLSISGGFTSGLFAVIDNSTLADVYTICANQIAKGIEKAWTDLPPSPSAEACKAAFNTLLATVTSARTDLDRARTDSAVAAVLRAKGQVEKLQEVVASMATTTSTSISTTTSTSTNTTLP